MSKWAEPGISMLSFWWVIPTKPKTSTSRGESERAIKKENSMEKQQVYHPACDSTIVSGDDQISVDSLTPVNTLRN